MIRVSISRFLKKIENKQSSYIIATKPAYAGFVFFCWQLKHHYIHNMFGAPGKYNYERITYLYKGAAGFTQWTGQARNLGGL